jgi:hypothetical protein
MRHSLCCGGQETARLTADALKAQPGSGYTTMLVVLHGNRVGPLSKPYGSGVRRRRLIYPVINDGCAIHEEPHTIVYCHRKLVHSRA